MTLTFEPTDLLVSEVTRLFSRLELDAERLELADSEGAVNRRFFGGDGDAAVEKSESLSS